MPLRLYTYHQEKWWVYILDYADQIVVIDKGRIVQQGTHDQLMKQEGIYKRFVNSREQAASWKLTNGWYKNGEKYIDRNISEFKY